jgi:hypothetical protein
MTAPTKPPPWGEFQPSIQEIFTQSDRAVAIVSAAVIDEILSRVLGAYFLDDAACRESLMGPGDRPLGSLLPRNRRASGQTAVHLLQVAGDLAAAPAGHAAACRGGRIRIVTSRLSPCLRNAGRRRTIRVRRAADQSDFGPMAAARSMLPGRADRYAVGRRINPHPKDRRNVPAPAGAR